jgi:O-antigen ligase
MAKNKILTERSMMYFIVAIFIVYLLQYFLTVETLKGESGRDNIVINSAYYFVSLLPLMGVLFIKKASYFSFYSIALYLVISGAKRGAILTFIVGSIIAFYFLLKDADRRHRFRNSILILTGLVTVIYFGYQQFLANEFLQYRFEMALEGDTSNRDIIYSNIFYNWLNSENVLNLFWGYGFNGSIILSDSYAHNDWLEILAGQGLFGLFIYIAIIYNLWKYYSRNNSLMNSQVKSIYLSVLCMWIIQSLFSSVYGGFFTFTYIIGLSYTMGIVDDIKSSYSKATVNVKKS